MKRLLWLIIMASALFLAWYVGLFNYLTLAAIKQEAHFLQLSVEQHYFWSVALYIMTYAIVVGLGLPVIAPFSIVGGYLFGVVPGVIYALISISMGSLIYFFMARILLKNILRGRYAQRLDNFNASIEKYGYTYLVTLHFLTIIPLFVINTLAACANVPLWSFVWTLVVGSFPIVFIYKLAGRELGTIHSMKDILKPQIILVLVVLALFALAPIIVRKWRAKYEG